MARPRLAMGTRQVVPRFWDNEELADLAATSGVAPDIRLTMIGLWAASDALGRFEWRPKMLAAKIYPYNSDHQATVEPAMNLFVQHGYLLKYDADGKSYGAWPHWREHNDFRSGKSEYPVPPKGLLPRNPPQSPQNVNVNAEKECKGRSENKNANEQSQSSNRIPTPVIHSSFEELHSHSGQSQSKPESWTDQVDEELSALPTAAPGKDTKGSAAALRLAAAFHKTLPQKNRAAAPKKWQTLWAKDFAGLLKTADEAEIMDILADYRRTSKAKYVVRAQTFVEMYDVLTEAVNKYRQAVAARRTEPEEDEEIIVKDIPVEEI